MPGVDAILLRREPAFLCGVPGRLDRQVNEPDQLLSNLGQIAVGAAGRRNAELPAKVAERGAENELGRLFAHRLRRQPGEDEPGDAPIGQAHVSRSQQMKLEALDAKGALELVVVGPGMGKRS
jgi:hypothetical protein